LEGIKNLGGIVRLLGRSVKRKLLIIEHCHGPVCGDLGTLRYFSGVDGGASGINNLVELYRSASPSQSACKRAAEITRAKYFF
jgi:hypothetical protein